MGRSQTGSHRQPARGAPAGAQAARGQPRGARGVVVGAGGGGRGRLRRGECRLSGRNPTHNERSGRDGSQISLLGRLVLDLRDVPTATPNSIDPDAPAGGYVLVYNPPDQRVAGYGQGWSLTAWPPQARTRATSLAARGGVRAGPRVAKAVAARVLAEHGVPVAGWRDPAGSDEPGGLTMFRARLGPATDQPDPRPAERVGRRPRIRAPRTRA